MAALNDKFDVLRGWDVGGDASVEESFPARLVSSVPVTLAPGVIVTLASTGFVDVATTGDITATPPLLVWVVVEGNNFDYSTKFLKKVVCLRGKLTLKTDKLAAAQTFPINGRVSFSAGLLTDCGATDQSIGRVSANNVATDGTITVQVDL